MRPCVVVPVCDCAHVTLHVVISRCNCAVVSPYEHAVVPGCDFAAVRPRACAIVCPCVIAHAVACAFTVLLGCEGV